MSIELRKIVSRAGVRSSEFWALVLAMGATLGGAKLGVGDSVLIAMWGGVSTYAGARTWRKNSKTKALAGLEPDA